MANQKPAMHGVRPAVDVTLNSLNKHFGKNMIGVILTGMGSDGTLGMSILHSAGGYVIAEDESTCVVWGMPRSVVEAGAADAILPRPKIAKGIERIEGVTVHVGNFLHGNTLWRLRQKLGK